MKIVILGAGVIGVTQAWYLAEAGHEVTVIDRQAAPAMETSFANAGEISPGYSAPWAAPGVPLKAMKWVFQRHAPLVVNFTPEWSKLVWMTRMLMNCTASAYAVNKARMVRLAEYSRDCLVALRDQTGIEYDGRQQGTLQLFRTDKQVEGAAKDIAVLREGGVPFEVLDRAGCIAAEPGLAGSADLIAGGLRLPHDETGDCHIFTGRLAEMAAARGVTFRWGVTVQAIRADAGRITGVDTDQGPLSADAWVLAMGPHSAAMARPLGIRLPIYPMKGYSITLPVVDESRAPQSTVMDETYKVAITRLGDRIRVGGLAEINGYNLSLDPRRKETLVQSVEALFTGAGDEARAEFWTGLRPMTPDGTPVVGRSPYPNLFLNTGHGTLGWTMAAGSGRLLADIISGHAPDIQYADLGYGRYQKGSRRAPGRMVPVAG
ncbi:MAG: D-amino acid dehydrogenase [Rubellimicrobium sp.]|nr:D-amino acid dehydrogenase [Rubellimicrobium sp.]